MIEKLVSLADQVGDKFDQAIIKKSHTLFDRIRHDRNDRIVATIIITALIIVLLCIFVALLLLKPLWVLNLLCFTLACVGIFMIGWFVWTILSW